MCACENFQKVNLYLQLAREKRKAYTVCKCCSFFLSFFLRSICPICRRLSVVLLFVLMWSKKKLSLFLRSRVVSRREKCRFEVVSFVRCLLTSLFFSLFFLFLLSRDVRNCQFETRALASSRRREISFGDEASKKTRVTNTRDTNGEKEVSVGKGRSV